MGFNNLCYIRAPCQILCHEVIIYSLNYLKEVEQGWGEEVGPRGLNKACVLFSGKRSRFE